MAATGLKKGSLYAAFGEKRSLYDKAIMRYDTTLIHGGIVLLNDQGVSGEARISALFDLLVRDAETPKGRWGCLLCNAAAENVEQVDNQQNAIIKPMNRLKWAIANALEPMGYADKTDLIWAAYFGGRVLVKSGAPKIDLARLKEQVIGMVTSPSL